MLRCFEGCDRFMRCRGSQTSVCMDGNDEGCESAGGRGNSHKLAWGT